MMFGVNLLNIQEYEALRQEIVENNSNMTGVVMRDKEVKLDGYLSELKREYIENCGSTIHYGVPTLKDKNIRWSRLYRFCSRLPKGGDLHVHDMALLPVCELIPLLETCPEFCINTDRRSFDLISVPENESVPDGYMRFCDAMHMDFYSVDELIENWTAIGHRKSGMGIWTYFEELFNRHAVLSGNVGFAEKYYNHTFRYYCRHNIMHVEIHIMLTDSLDESEEYIKAVRRAYYNVKKDFPYFTVKMIGAGVKADSEDIAFTKKCFLNASYVQETVKDESGATPTNFLIGFDLVNEEDTSLPLHAFAPMLLKVKKQYPDMKLYIHGGESLDARNDNLIDAYLLGVSRVGHGLNLYRYPDLHARYVRSEICLEVCPISNRTLEYTRDMRNHPATEYLRSGIPMALCSDDPTYMENETLTDDFFAAVLAWNINIADIKQLGINSIMYSGLSDEEKYSSLKAYNDLWNDFVEEMLEKGM